jgi:hypothetical protein
MTVPLASDQSSPSQGLLMPKLKYRFRVVFENFGTEGSGSVPVIELTKQVVDFTRPSISFSNIDVPVYNSTIKLAGKYSWENLTCTLRDDAGGNVSKLVGEQLQKQLDFMEMSSAASGIDYKFLTRFEVLDGGNGAKTPIALETWEIYGCYLQSVNYGDMNYGTSEAATVALTIAFDNANQINSAGVAVGVGQAINTTVNNVATGAG